MEKKKYNLITAIAMVVGIVIGSGVFFKATDVLKATGGNLVLAILAWLIGGLVMIISAYSFSLIAANSKKGCSIPELAEETVGRRHSYVMSVYFSVLYYPVLSGILAWLCADFTKVLLSSYIPDSFEVWFVVIMSFVYMIGIFLVNFISPKIAGYLQISATIVKVIPLLIMAVVGVFFGLFNSDGVLLENLASTSLPTPSGFMGALCATCFAYEGWIVATSIAKELKNPKKELPRALVIGTIIILAVYLLYFIGLAGTYLNIDFINNGKDQILLAFSKIFGSVAGTTLYVFIIISCVGTLNGLLMGTVRSFRNIGLTNNGYKPEKFIVLNKFNLNTLSCVVGFGLALFWMAYWLLSLYTDFFFMDLSELCIIFVYLSYIPMYISMIKNREDLNSFNRYVMPILAIMSAVLMIVACIFAHKINCLIFAILVVIILLIGLKFYKEDDKVESNN